MGLFRMIGRVSEARAKQHQHKLKSQQFAADYQQLTDGGAELAKDLYLFLRPLSLGGAVRFPNLMDQRPTELVSFEDVLTRALDVDGRRGAVCVGEGGEKWGAARIHFEADWEEKIVPLFQRAAAIISIPGHTANCLKESYVIRKRPELLAKTVFIIPPIGSYQPPLFSERMDSDMAEFSAKVVAAHHDSRIGLYLPRAEPNAGVFVTMDYASGRVRQQLPWQIYQRTEINRSRFAGTRQTTTTAYLGIDRLRAAIRKAQG